jgi:hypothetical protein
VDFGLSGSREDEANKMKHKEVQMNNTLPNFEPCEWISINHAAVWLDMKAKTLYRLCEMHNVRHVAIPSSGEGKRQKTTYRLHKLSLLKFIAQNTVPADPPRLSGRPRKETRF